MLHSRTLIFCIFLLVLAGCSGGQQQSGSGVQVSVMNMAELQDIYAPIGGIGAQGLSDTPGVYMVNNEQYSLVSNMNVMVHNKGYADSIAALYVTGYDPNLFYVAPSGPFYRQEGTRFCYKDIILESQLDYSVSAICALENEVYVGGGFTQSGNTSEVSVDLWLDSVAERLQNSDSAFWSTFGSFTRGAQISCDFQRESKGRVDHRCSFTTSFLDFLNRQQSRGLLLLALYGEDVRNCKNGCTLVPSPRLPRNYIAGNTADFPGGEMYNIDYGIYLNELRWPSNYNTHEQLFQISACYLYTTYATPIVCIDPTPTSSDGDVCRPGVQQINHGQPAPLSITKIDQVNQGPRVMFTIHVQNQLSGTPFNPGAIDFCAPGAPEVYNRELRNVAKVIDARVIGELGSLDCRDGTIRLDNRGQGQISCFYDLPEHAGARGAYQTSLNIEIGYLYRNIQTIQATIHRI
jgi:hypothetical protein